MGQSTDAKNLEKWARMTEFESALYQKNYKYIAGVDEAGRGPLAGPVVAAACVLDSEKPILGLDDSKKLSEKKRDMLYDIIIQESLAFSIVEVTAGEIDRINILEATKQAMRQCIKELSPTPDFVLLDAVTLNDLEMPSESIIKGDARSVSIAAASVLAKVTRDQLMYRMDRVYPGYSFSKHKGYGTKAHYEALDAHGMCPIHRRSFLKKWVAATGE